MQIEMQRARETHPYFVAFVGTINSTLTQTCALPPTNTSTIENMQGHTGLVRRRLLQKRTQSDLWQQYRRAWRRLLRAKSSSSVLIVPWLDFPPTRARPRAVGSLWAAKLRLREQTSPQCFGGEIQKLVDKMARECACLRCTNSPKITAERYKECLYLQTHMVLWSCQWRACTTFTPCLDSIFLLRNSRAS